MATRLIFLILLWKSKLISFLISFFRIGQASNFPGKLALLFQKGILRNFNFSKDCKLIFITGTNGKSTTSGLLANFLKLSGKKVFYNKSGANLLSGIITTLCHYSNLFGTIKADFIIFEVDEATLPLLTAQLKPDLIAVTNFFRDQLDRFGELDTAVRLIEKGINNLSTDLITILNADDPRVAFLSINTKKVFYGFEKNTFEDLSLNHYKNKDSEWINDPEEATNCPKCRESLNYKIKFLAHLGDYECLQCGAKRPNRDFEISNYKADNLATNLDITFNNHRNNFFTSMIGTFNLYNVLCAISIAKTISNITNTQIQKGFQSYSTIFGRGEKALLKNKVSWIYLIKNPTGTTEVLKTLLNIEKARFVIGINDNFADGRDVSWIWDARFDLLSEHNKPIFVTGKRALDMGLRLKYSNIDSKQIYINENVEKTIHHAVSQIDKDETLYILPTYTVLLEMQKKGLCKKQSL